ncbi:MAG: thioredoxin domain-containing protein [Bacteroidetes bacterium]|nr:thioredoxin domain-containing protein [Bacteroidota bacterium]
MKDNPKYTNELIHESSPYLLQHAHNPVNWMPWGTAAFEKAKAEDKLVLVSIGYSSCHWCHVMEHESFEDEVIAKIMNDNFVCIKVDREERPDVDQIYMNAVQLMTGSGGWPLNCFTLPDGRPVYGGTYFPKEQWSQVLQNLHYTYQKDKAKVLEYADELTQGIQQTELIEIKTGSIQFEQEKLHEMLVNWKRNFDTVRGGNTRAPKFPMPNNYEFLMQYAWHTGDTAVMNHVDLTLQKMAMGGIYDQIRGGFSRYSVDSLWRVPHFEKMLYDNAQLISLYSKAYQRTKNPLYKQVVSSTIQWLYAEMKNGEGGYYSALDADSEGEEGKFYVWSEEEMKRILEDDYERAKEYYKIEPSESWEGHYILQRSMTDSAFAVKHNMSVEDVELWSEIIGGKLLTERVKRVRPGKDDKSLTSWNALVAIAMADAYDAFGQAHGDLTGAVRIGTWIVKNQMKKDGKLLHTRKNGKSTIDGFLDDYSFTAEAFIRLYEITFDETWIARAQLLTEYAIAHFYDSSSGMFFYTSDEATDLIARKMEISDNVIPSSNSSMAKVLFKLGTLLANESYIEKSKQMLANVYDGMETYGSAYSNWGILAMNLVYPYYEVAVTGEQWPQLSAELNRYYQPNKVLMGGTSGKLPLLDGKFGGESMIYVCVNKTCQMPVTEVPKALIQMRAN